MTLQYDIGPHDYAVQFDYAMQPHLASSRFRYYHYLAYPIFVLLLALWCAIQANQPFFFAIFLLALGWYLMKNLSHKKTYERERDEACALRSRQRITMRVDEEGLTEELDGLKSFAPWNSIKRYIIFEDTILIELPAEMWAIIPRADLEISGGSMDDFMEVLERYDIPKEG